MGRWYRFPGSKPTHRRRKGKRGAVKRHNRELTWFEAGTGRLLVREVRRAKRLGRRRLF